MSVAKGLKYTKISKEKGSQAHKYLDAVNSLSSTCSEVLNTNDTEQERIPITVSPRKQANPTQYVNTPSVVLKYARNDKKLNKTITMNIRCLLFNKNVLKTDHTSKITEFVRKYHPKAFFSATKTVIGAQQSSTIA